MLKDAYGNEIKVGDTVRHLFPPAPKGKKGVLPPPAAPPGSYHDFFGSSTVVWVSDRMATVTAATKGQIPTYCGKLLVVEKGADGRALATE